MDRLRELEEQLHNKTNELVNARTEESVVYCELVVKKRLVKNLEDQKRAIEQSIMIEKKLIEIK